MQGRTNFEYEAAKNIQVGSSIMQGRTNFEFEAAKNKQVGVECREEHTLE